MSWFNCVIVTTLAVLPMAHLFANEYNCEQCDQEFLDSVTDFQQIDYLSKSIAPIIFEQLEDHLKSLPDQYHISKELMDGYQGISDMSHGWDNLNDYYTFQQIELGRMVAFEAPKGFETFSSAKSAIKYHQRKYARAKDMILFGRIRELSPLIEECRNNPNCSKDEFDALQTELDKVFNERQAVLEADFTTITATDMQEVFDRYPSAAKLFLEQYGHNFNQARSEVRIYETAALVMTANSSQEALQVLREKSNNLSGIEKVKLVATLGSLFNEEYDVDRNSESLNFNSNSPDIVSSEEIFQNAGQALEGKRTDGAGVCRDIASYQANMLSALGMENVYVIAYGSTRGQHATVYAEDPATGKSHKLNYGNMSESSDEGVGAIEQEWDAALSYQVYKPDGGRVATIPSEKAQIILEGIKGKDALESTTPFYQAPQGNRVNSVEILNNDQIIGRSFVAIDSHGKTYAGVGLLGKFSNEILEGNAGASLTQVRYAEDQMITTSRMGHDDGSVTRTREAVENDTSQNILSLHADTTAKVDIKMNNSTVTPFVRADINAAFNPTPLTNITADQQATIKADDLDIGYYMDFSTGFRAISYDKNGMARILSAEVHAKPGFDDIRAASLGNLDRLELSFDHASVEASIENKLSDTAVLITAAGIHADNFGISTNYSARLEDEWGAVELDTTISNNSNGRPNFSKAPDSQVNFKGEIFVDEATTGWSDVTYSLSEEKLQGSLGIRINLH